MKQYVSFFLLILLLSACAPTQVESAVPTMTFTWTATPVTPRATDTPNPPTATPRPPTATTDPTKAYITMMWGTKSVLLTANPAPTIPTETPTPTLLPGSLACRPTDLHTTFVGDSGAAGHLILAIRVDNTRSTDCFLPAYPVVQLFDPNRMPLNLTYSFSVPDGPIVLLQPTDEAQSGQPARYGLKHGQSALLELWWSNQCANSGRLPNDFIIHIELLDKVGTIEIAIHKFHGGIGCYDPAIPPTLNIGPFEAVVNP